MMSKPIYYIDELSNTSSELDDEILRMLIYNLS